MFVIVHTYVKNNVKVLLDERVLGNKKEQRYNKITEQDFCRVPDAEKACKFMFRGTEFYLIIVFITILPLVI